MRCSTPPERLRVSCGKGGLRRRAAARTMGELALRAPRDGGAVGDHITDKLVAEAVTGGQGEADPLCFAQSRKRPTRWQSGGSSPEPRGEAPAPTARPVGAEVVYPRLLLGQRSLRGCATWTSSANVGRAAARRQLSLGDDVRVCNVCDRTGTPGAS